MIQKKTFRKREVPDMERKLHKSKNDKWIAGVCGGLAEYAVAVLLRAEFFPASESLYI